MQNIGMPAVDYLPWGQGWFASFNTVFWRELVALWVLVWFWLIYTAVQAWDYAKWAARFRPRGISGEASLGTQQSKRARKLAFYVAAFKRWAIPAGVKQKEGFC